MKQDSKDDTRALVDATREIIKATLDLEQGGVNDSAALNRVTLAILSALGQRLPLLCRHGCRNVKEASRTIDLTGLTGPEPCPVERSAVW